MNMRIDKFLKVSRIIKRRTVANEACDAGRVSLICRNPPKKKMLPACIAQWNNVPKPLIYCKNSMGRFFCWGKKKEICGSIPFV